MIAMLEVENPRYGGSNRKRFKRILEDGQEVESEEYEDDEEEEEEEVIVKREKKIIEHVNGVKETCQKQIQFIDQLLDEFENNNEGNVSSRNLDDNAELRHTTGPDAYASDIEEIRMREEEEIKKQLEEF